MSVEGWKTGKLGKLCKIEIGGTPMRDNPEYWDSQKETDNLWVSIRDMNQRVINDTAEYITNIGVKNSNAKLQHEGTILLSFKLTIGRVAFAGKQLYTNEAIAALQTEQLTHNFLYYGLQQWNLLQDVDQAIKGATLNKTKLNKIEFQYPVSLQEQTQIATILSTIDRAIEQTEALIAKQQRIKTGLMQDLLTKGIDENGNIRSEETHEFKDSPLGRIPVEWEVVTTGQVTKSLVPGRDKPDLDGGGVPWITIPDIEGMYLDLPKSGLSLSLNAIKVANARLMPKGTVLMSCVGEFGIATITECDAVANQQLHGFICDQSILPEWLIAQINASGNRIDNMATQTTIKYLNKNGCESILITLPSLKEQVKIISILDNINDLFEKQKKSLNKLRSLKTGLMQDLLTGKVRVTELIKERETDNL